MNEKKLVENLRDIKGILDDAGVKYWLDYGTLLGAVRDGKFIPWDIPPNIDFGTMCTEVYKVIAKIPEMEQKGFIVEIADYSIYIWRWSAIIHINLYSLKEDSAWMPWLSKKPKFDRVTKYFARLGERLLYRNLPSSRKRRLRVKIAFALIPSFADYMVRKFLFRICEWLGAKTGALVVPKSYFEKLDSISFYGMTFNIPSPVHDYLPLLYAENWRNPDPNWGFSQYPAIDYNFDIGKREDLSPLNYLTETEK